MKNNKKFNLSFFYNSLENLWPPYKKTILLLFDIGIIFFVTTFIFLIEKGNINSSSNQQISLIAFLTIFISSTLGVYVISGQYRGLSLYVGSINLYQSLFRNTLAIILTTTTFGILGIDLPSLRVNFLILIFVTFIGSFIKVLIRDLFLFFKHSNKKNKKRIRVAIYGAGDAGIQLSASLKFSSEYFLVCFFDDNENLWGRNIRGIPIHKPSTLEAKDLKIDYVLLSIPSLSSSERLKIIKSIRNYNCPVLEVPSLEEIASGKAKIDNLKPISIEDILGRETVLPDLNLLGPGITSGLVLVTGAGGSIGSELCRQILSLEPELLVLLDFNEHALYEIRKELINSKFYKNNVASILGDFASEEVLTQLFLKYKIDIIFHAAAYKHVPLVEENPLQGIYNNSIGTYNFCKSIVKKSFEGTFVLISTDKAVRPTNIMGASKRLSELIVQSFAYDISSFFKIKKSKFPKFSMVRFGNVLNSSGSVVPLFEEQIKSGGPITLTHNDVTRYFMTIPEAAQLVIQASVLTECGDVFLLDMGEPIKIKELAIKMIKLAGLKVKNKKNKSGDIEIKTVGLRKGEKLYEELLIDGKSSNTIHPLIYRAKEKSISPNQLWPKIELLEKTIKNSNLDETLKLIKIILPECNFIELN